ncbi:hypothetical protein GF407_02680 [candidate division KSB1 bacterium]|nr:hypothetical protein [candidate division KSB1 bacterium]
MPSIVDIYERYKESIKVLCILPDLVRYRKRLFKKNGEIVLKAMQADQVNPYKQNLAEEIADNIEHYLLPEVFASDSSYQTFTDKV